MYGVSAAFLTALSNNHLVSVKVEVLAAGQVVSTLTGKILPGSKVSAVKGQPIRRNCSVKMIDDTGTLTPTDASALLAPYGNELRIWRGIQFADGTSEFASLGVFEITDCHVVDAGAGVSIDISGVDRADEVSRSTLTDIYSIAAGTNAVTAAKTLIANARSGLTFSLPVTSYNTPLLIYQGGDDPWTKAISIAQMFGGEIFFDAVGDCVIQYEPTPYTQATVQTFAEGATCTMTDLDRAWTNRSIPNNVIREGAGTGVATPVRAVAQDTNPSSPTYISGKYGTVTDYLVDSKLLTTQQCQDAAKAALRLSKGKLEQMALQGIPNPALDIGDVVSVTRAKLGVGANYVIDALTIPLDFAAKMALTLRRVIQ